MTVIAACSEISRGATRPVWGEWSVQVVSNRSEPFWGLLTIADAGILVFGFGGPRVVMTWPVRK